MPPTRRGYILAVDDDSDMRALIEMVLSSAGHEVELATDGEEALAAIGRRRPDLLLLDMVMPGLNGWGVLRRMPPGGPPIVVMSGEYISPTAFGLGGHGVMGYVPKPFDKKTLLDACERILDPSRAKPTAAVKDRRGEPRIALDVPASLVQADRSALAVGRALDLSAHGVRLRLGTNLATGQAVRLLVDLRDGGEPLYLEGVARWSQAGATGVELTFMDEPSRARIAAAIAQAGVRARDPSGPPLR
jgi:DNA-binding response OmpR family regulator